MTLCLYPIRHNDFSHVGNVGGELKEARLFLPFSIALSLAFGIFSVTVNGFCWPRPAVWPTGRNAVTAIIACIPHPVLLPGRLSELW